jgi:hypothetical protein
MKHIVYKPTVRIETKFNVSELSETDNNNFKNQNQKYTKDNLTSEENDLEIVLLKDKELYYAFDYVNKSQKYIIPEVNPVTIFFSNAVMSLKYLSFNRQQLLENSTVIKNGKIDFIEDNPLYFGLFFQYSANIILNIQASLEAFLNSKIPTDYVLKSAKHTPIKKLNIHQKIDLVFPELYNLNFENCNKAQYDLVTEIIQIRNDIVHIKPSTSNVSKTKYKDLYKNLIDFPYHDAINSTRLLINFYEPKLIEDCDCGVEYYFQTIIK